MAEGRIRLMPLPLRHPGALVAILLVLPELAAAAERCAVPAGHIAAVEDLVEVAAGADWTRLALGEPLCVGDTLRAGENGRSAVILNSGAVLRLAPGTTLRIEQAQPGERTLLQLVTGIASFFSRRPHALEIDTPFADAAVEGTEFTLEVEPDRSRLTVLEGRVRFGNALGTVRVAPGEAAVAIAGRAPELELRIRPRDAVQWALYYPPLPESRLPAGALPPLREAARLAAQGRRAEALARLDQLPPPARDATALTLRAELLLAQGRPAEAETTLAEALARDPRSADALALRAVIAVARNMKDQALAAAREAVTLNPANPRARLALSYAAQAAFDIPLARESLEAAAASTPDDALIQARLAEVQLMQGDTRAARRSASRAVELNPDSPRAQTVAGFVALARVDTRTAHATFTRAIELDPFNPLAHLGQGLATIRNGNLEAGRTEIELAVALDPDNALLRSYLGKAYLEERRDTIAADELATAKALDPNDPTPWFYDAVRKQLENRPIEALRDIEASIALNRSRSIYRAPALLDQDLSARSTNLAQVYRDLGFSQLALVQGWRSLADGARDASIHRFLAESYGALPLHQIARDSELLQARLLAPLTSCRTALEEPPTASPSSTATAHLPQATPTTRGSSTATEW
jgi:tetratricopeptide (TPR) repeat protein